METVYSVCTVDPTDGKSVQELGIPTANLSEESIGSALGSAVTGIYYGWASVGASEVVHQMVMSVGFNPFYKNSIKTCEPWLLHEFAEVCASHCLCCRAQGNGLRGIRALRSVFPQGILSPVAIRMVSI